MNIAITYTRTIDGVDWDALKCDLAEDAFDNGRTPLQLRRSFANSQGVCFAWVDGKVVGKGRVLSDGVCNAYLVDLWTQSEFRGCGIGTEILRRLTTDLPGQHVYLQANDEHVPFYENLGFSRQPSGLSKVIGRWLDGRRIREDSRIAASTFRTVRHGEASRRNVA